MAVARIGIPKRNSNPHVPDFTYETFDTYGDFKKRYLEVKNIKGLKVDEVNGAWCTEMSAHGIKMLLSRAGSEILTKGALDRDVSYKPS